MLYWIHFTVALLIAGMVSLFLFVVFWLVTLLVAYFSTLVGHRVRERLRLMG
jgi:hypothetical protein